MKTVVSAGQRVRQMWIQQQWFFRHFGRYQDNEAAKISLKKH